MKKLMVAVALLNTGDRIRTGCLIDGTWKIDAATAKFPEKPEKYEIKDGPLHMLDVRTPVSMSRRMAQTSRSRDRSTATRSP